ncbi:GerAB/ArcD/ProY family transporter [Bacillus taeanensis]|nr:endospore germination permease [Bacillus taeanensis]
MKKEKTISSGQMACLFLSFILGSAIINIPQPLVQAANNGAWLSVIIANGLAMFLLACVFYLYHKNPNFNLIDCSQKMLGKWITLGIFIPILFLLFLNLSYIVIDIGGFFANAMMRETPVYVFHVLILFVAALTAKAGIEVMARMFVVLLSYVILFSVIVLVLALPYYHVENLLPVFPEGVKPVVHGTYITFSFPYSELVLFSLLLPFVHKEKEKSLKKKMFLVLVIHEFLLISAILCTIMALGSLAGTLKFSLFQLARLINIREIITRIESFIGIALIVGSYMKTTIMLFILKETLVKVFKLKDDRIIIFPVAFTSLLLTLTMYETDIEFGEAVFIVWPLFIMTVVVLPFLIITAIALFRGKKIETNHDSY